jgi:hypothetical protein
VPQLLRCTFGICCFIGHHRHWVFNTFFSIHLFQKDYLNIIFFCNLFVLKLESFVFYHTCTKDRYLNKSMASLQWRHAWRSQPAKWRHALHLHAFPCTLYMVKQKPSCNVLLRRMGTRAGMCIWSTQVGSKKINETAQDAVAACVGESTWNAGRKVAAWTQTHVLLPLTPLQWSTFYDKHISWGGCVLWMLRMEYWVNRRKPKKTNKILLYQMNTSCINYLG